MEGFSSFSECVEGGMKISKNLSAGFLKIMAKYLLAQVRHNFLPRYVHSDPAHKV